MGARKRIKSKEKAHKQEKRQPQKQQQQQGKVRAVSPSGSTVQAAAAALAGVGCSRRLQYALGLGALAIAVVLCAVSSSAMMRMGAGAGTGERAPVGAAAGGKGGSGRGSRGDEPVIRASSKSWLRGLQRLGVGIVDLLGLGKEEPVETRRRRQVLEGMMRFNGVPIQRYPAKASTKRRGADAVEEQQRQLAEEAEALAAMAQRPVLSFNGREPDCLTGVGCSGAPTAQRLVQARSGSGSGSGTRVV